MKKVSIFKRQVRIEIIILSVLILGLFLFVAQSTINSRNTLKQANSLQAESVSGPDFGINKFESYIKPSIEQLRQTLSPLQYEVTQEDATEQPFNNPYWDLKEEGIYVDIVSGEPIFSSRDKYDSGTGWPSFTKPLDARYVTTNTDNSLAISRVEVRSKYANSHLGHVFNDGPVTLERSGGAEPTGLRYCLNSASLRFVPKADLIKEGLGIYEKYL